VVARTIGVGGTGRTWQMRFIIGVGLAMALVALAHPAPARAQQLTTGTITGVVQDDQGLRMPGVTVEIKNEQTNDIRTTVSNETGMFTMAALPLGRYSLRLVVEGFATVERLGIQLRSGEVYNAGTITLSVAPSPNRRPFTPRARWSRPRTPRRTRCWKRGRLNRWSPAAATRSTCCGRCRESRRI